MKRVLMCAAALLLAIAPALAQIRISQGAPPACIGQNYIVLDAANNVLYSCGAAGTLPTPAGDAWVSSQTSNTAQATANVTTDQNLLASTVGTTAQQFPMNTPGRFAMINTAGTYNLGAASTITVKVKLCSVAGCGSGTVVTLLSWTTGSQATTGVTLGWNLDAWCSTVANGSSGSLECHGSLNFDAGATLAAAATTFNDSNIAAVTGAPLNAQWFLQTSLAYGTANASNTALARTQVVQINGAGVLN